jgi:choline dehydrogenase-like flavoprotein
MAGGERADVLIVGAGAGGAVAARRLAEEGFDVVCLEQGDWPDHGRLRGAELDWELTGLKEFAWDPNVRGAPSDYPVDTSESDIDVLMVNAVGGSTVGWAAQWPRFLPSDFRVRSLDGVADDWPISYEDLAPYYARGDRDWGISGLGGDPAYPPGDAPPLPALPLGPAGHRVARAHNELGWHWWPGYNAIASRAWGPLKPCVQRGVCPWGCPDGAKATVDVTPWPAAIAHGARLVTGARVARIEVDGQGRATGATWIDRDGAEHFQAASVVVLAGNGIGTARLLLMSASGSAPDGLANSSGLVGKRLMLHPFATVTGLFDDFFESWQGQWGNSIQCTEFYETDESRGFVRGAKWGLQPTGGPLNAALPWSSEPDWGAAVHERVARRLGHSVMWGVISEDLPEEANDVTLAGDRVDSSGLPAAKVRYRLSENTRRLLDFHTARASESLVAAGASETLVNSPVRGTGWHLLGTARMGDDPATSVVDPWCRAHDVENLLIVDGSVFVTSAGVNPTPTIAALALRAADRLIAQRRSQAVPA